MKYLKQFSIIISISFIGEVISWLIPLPIPASIYGMAILYLLLSAKILKEEMIAETADFLISIMSVMFVPASVAIIERFDALHVMLVPFLLAVTLNTVIVMATVGKIADKLHKKEETE